MEKSQSIEVVGGRCIQGNVHIHGDKVSAAHLLFASIVALKSTSIRNLPMCGDVLKIIDWIKSEGAAIIEYLEGEVVVTPNIADRLNVISIAENRASICLSSALALKNDEIVFSDVGGCDFARRKINRHLKLVETFGFEITERSKRYFARRKSKPKEVNFNCSTSFGPSVGVTCHALIAALVYHGRMVLRNCALEPASSLLVEFLKRATNKKVIREERNIIIEAEERVEYSEIAIKLPHDITEAFTYLAAAMNTGGNITLENIEFLPDFAANILFSMNARTFYTERGLNFDLKKIVHPKVIECKPWPAFQSDIGPIIIAGLCPIKGETRLIDTVYQERSSHVCGLNKIGYLVESIGQVVFVKGKRPIQRGTVKVEAKDIRAGAALVIGALGCESPTIIENCSQIFRGYSDLLENLQNLGADIKFREE